MNINPALLALISTGSVLLGVIVTSFFNLRIARINKDAEERKHQKELALKAAIENWKQTYDMIRQAGLRGKMQPMDVFLVHMSALIDVVFDPTTTAENLKERLAKVDALVEIAGKAAKDLKPIEE